MNQFKSAVKAVLIHPALSNLARSLVRNSSTIFMLHRFAVPELGVAGHDPEFVRNALAYLRKQRYSLLSLSEVFDRLHAGSKLDRTVAFTIDDGYFDHSEIGAAVFAEFDCPVTTFVTTGFLDGAIWFWWDQIEYIFDSTKLQHFRLSLNGALLDYKWQAFGERQGAMNDLIQRCKIVPDRVKRQAIDDLSRIAEVEVPKQPPERYSAMSWDDLRGCERKTMTFGPHTVTHPILSRTDDHQCRQEILGSWQRLQQEATKPVPIFCYPNGQEGDFGEREVRIQRDVGLKGAVVGTFGYAAARKIRRDQNERFLVRRLGFRETMADLVQCVTGIERLKQLVRMEN